MSSQRVADFSLIWIVSGCRLSDRKGNIEELRFLVNLTQNSSRERGWIAICQVRREAKGDSERLAGREQC